MGLIDNVSKEYGFSFAANTTYGCGGAAKVAYFPASFNQAIDVYDYLISEKIDFITLGKGSDVLASDEGFDGAVICTRELGSICFTEKNKLFCGAGTTVSSLLKWCLSNGAGGLEFLYGIPATIGGLTYMNGGINSKHIGDIVNSVTFYDGKKQVLTQKQCHFGNKYSIMRDVKGIILGVEFEIEQKSAENIAKDISMYRSARSMQPKGRSCGCVFKNPQGLSAGKIIDECGLKGFSIGGAVVSRDHANFIINNGKSSSDVFKLINEVKKHVKDRSGILLEEEVVYIGEFNGTFS